jgi:hypothetical protein
LSIDAIAAFRFYSNTESRLSQHLAVAIGESHMLNQYMDQIEALGLNLFFAAIFFFIGMAIHDVLKQGQVPKFGRFIVWLVLFLGCAGFIAKGIIQMTWEGSGIG